jgi:hypothetical protein
VIEREVLEASNWRLKIEKDWASVVLGQLALDLPY